LAIRIAPLPERAVLAHKRYLRAAAAALLCVAFAVGSALPASAAQRSAPGKHQPKLTKKQRAKLRQSLKRQLHRNPAIVLNHTFIRKAAIAELHMPMSVRLSKSDGVGGYEPSNDQLEITWDDSVFAWPLAGGMIAAPQTVFLKGGFTLEAIFNGGDTSGYPELGTTETILGGGIEMSSDPFTISEFSTPCVDGPQLTTAPATPVTITSAGPRFGMMNLFSQEIQGTLSLRMNFASSLAASCGAAPAATPVVDDTAATPMPMRFAGKFAISPAITPDGKLRFGKVTVDDSVLPQLSTFAYVRSCTGTGTCDAQEFPARLKVKKLTAEVLLGDVLP
jgi:hypothetical protein